MPRARQIDKEKDLSHPQRINRILSLAGLTSRRKADEWIKQGRVSLNGQRVDDPGTRAIWNLDQILVDGQKIPGPSEKVYIMLNKPFGHICTLNDPQGRPLVTDLLKDVPQRVYPVGRLDFDTLGLLLLTNDGEWTYRLTHPRYKVPRTYKATIKGEISDDAIRRLRKGVSLKEGKTGPAKVSIVSRSETESIVRITITQGRSRQVRRMLEAVGHEVIHLIRTGYGKLSLGTLKVGTYRYLENEEAMDMKELVGLA
jgi:23S rRNA pseudouridine2605 synthase